MLRKRYRDERARLDVMPVAVSPIHGEPHPGNFLTTSAGLHLIDFEAACRGPIEWHLASLPMSVATHFDHLDAELLATLRVLNSIRVATWCFTSSAASMIEHGEHHLALVRVAQPPR